MGLISNLLMWPALGGPKIVCWLAQTLTEQAEREFLAFRRLELKTPQ